MPSALQVTYAKALPGRFGRNQAGNEATKLAMTKENLHAKERMVQCHKQHLSKQTEVPPIPAKPPHADMTHSNYIAHISAGPDRYECARR